MNWGNVAPTVEDLEEILDPVSEIRETKVLSDHWLRAHGNSETSILIWTERDSGNGFSVLEEGAGYLRSNDVGVVFIRSEVVDILGRQPHLTGKRKENIAADQFAELVADLLTTGTSGLQEISRRHIGALFKTILGIGNEGPAGEILEEPFRGEPYRPIWPRQLERSVAETTVGWLLRGDPECAIDLSDNSGFLPFTISRYCQERDRDNIDQFAVSHGNISIKTRRLVRAYTDPEHFPVNTEYFSYEELVDRIGVRMRPGLGAFAEAGDADLFDIATANLTSQGPRDVPALFKERASEYSLPLSHRMNLSPLNIFEGIASLRRGGKGVFVIEMGLLANRDFIAKISEFGRIHAIMLFGHPQEMPFEDILASTLAVVCFERDRKGSDSHEIRVIKVSSENLDSRVGRLLNCPTEHLSDDDAADIENVQFDLISQRDLATLRPRLLLYEPQIAAFLRSETVHPLEECVKEIRRGIRTGAKDFFFFEPGEINQYDMSSRFFTPLLMQVPTEAEQYVITQDDIEHYALDLREYIDGLNTEYEQLTESIVLESLRNDGYDGIVEYIEAHEDISNRAPLRHAELWFCPFWGKTSSAPDLVMQLRQISDQRWLRVDLDTVLIDDRWCLVDTGDRSLDGLHQLLCSEMYRRLLFHLGQSQGSGLTEFSLRRLQNIPIPVDAIDTIPNGNFRFPPKRRRDQRDLDQAIIDSCPDQAVQDGLESLLEPDDQFAWAWFLSTDEYEEFKALYHSDEEAAEQYVVERLDKDDVREMLNRISDVPLHDDRWDVITELVNEFEHENFRLFLYGATPQFEGLIMDWARENGHDVTWIDGRPYVEIQAPPGEDDMEPVQKGLGALIETFLPRGFGDFLYDSVKDMRDELAHGEVIEGTPDRATICFLSLQALALQIAYDNLGVRG